MISGSIQHVMGKGKGKGKSVPVQTWTGPEGSRRLRLPDFMTVCCQLYASAAFNSQ